MTVTVRPAAEQDMEFAYHAKRGALGPFIESRWGWHEDYQRAIHESNWREKPWSLICLDGEPVGTVSVDRRATTVRLGEFYILPARQRRGIGSQVLRQILLECDRDDRDCELFLLRGSQAAEFFRRCDFRVSGNDDRHVRMIRHAQVP